MLHLEARLVGLFAYHSVFSLSDSHKMFYHFDTLPFNVALLFAYVVSRFRSGGPMLAIVGPVLFHCSLMLLFLLDYECLGYFAEILSAWN